MKYQLTNAEYRALLDLFMCSDPWPVGGDDHDWTHDEITRLVDREARARGYADWIVAYHELGRPEPQPEASAPSAPSAPVPAPKRFWLRPGKTRGV